MEQEGVYKRKSSTLFRGIYIKPTYTVGKALGVILESVYY
jgi:hypothetical protein